MKCLEIISVRTSLAGQPVQEYLCAMCRDVRESSAIEANVYTSLDFPGDLAIILSGEGGSRAETKSGLGQMLAIALKSFGLVDHSVWVRVEQGAEQDTST